MKTVAAFCAVLVCVSCGATLSASARNKLAATLFTDVAPRPPGSIPHVRPAAPLPRPKPAEAPHSAPVAAAPAGPIVFPPVTPLE
jgi:hypothetical protein